MTTKLSDGAFNGFTRITKYLPPKRGGFFTSPRTDACPDGWGVANAVAPGTPGAPQDQASAPFGVCGDDKAIKRITYNLADKKWVVASFPGDQLFGNIDWRGPVKETPAGKQSVPEDKKPRHILSWYGPPSRYFPSDKFSYNPENELHCMLYSNGGVIGILPYPVLGAALIKGPDRHPKDADADERARVLSASDLTWMIVICKAGLNTHVYSKRFGTRVYKSDDLFAAEDASQEEKEAIVANKTELAAHWDLLANISSSQFTPTDQVMGAYSIQEQRTPWFFCESGDVAECIREVKITFEVLGVKNVQVTSYRTALELKSNAAVVHPLPFGTPYTYTINTAISTPGDQSYYTYLGQLECHTGDPPQCTPEQYENVPADHWWHEKEVMQTVTITGSRPVAVDWAGDQEIVAWMGMSGSEINGIRLMTGVDFVYFPKDAEDVLEYLPLAEIRLYAPGGVSVLATARDDLSVTGYCGNSTIVANVQAKSGCSWITLADPTLKQTSGGYFDFTFSVKENTSTNTRVGWITVTTTTTVKDATHTGPNNWEGKLRQLRYFVIQAGSDEVEVLPIPEELGDQNPPSFPYSSVYLTYQDDPAYKYNNNMDMLGCVEQGFVYAPNDFGGDGVYRDDYIGDYAVRQTFFTFYANMVCALVWQKPGTEDPNNPANWNQLNIGERTTGYPLNYLEILDGTTNTTPPATYEPAITPVAPTPGNPGLKSRSYQGEADEYIHFLDLRDTHVLMFENARQEETGFYGYNMELTEHEELAETRQFVDTVEREYHRLTMNRDDAIKFMEKQPARQTATPAVGWDERNLLYWPNNRTEEYVLNSYDGAYPACVMPFFSPDPLAYSERARTSQSVVARHDPLTLKSMFEYLGTGEKAYREGAIALAQEKDKLVSMQYQAPAPKQGDPDVVRYYNALVEKDKKVDIGVVALFSPVLKTDDDTNTFRLYPLGPV